MTRKSTSAPGGEDEDRSPEDELMITCLAEGWTHRQAANHVGVSTKTVQRRMADPDLAAAVAGRRRERVGQLSGQLISATDAAVAVLVNTLDHGDPKVSMRAATSILDYANRFHSAEEDRELARRQDELEQHLQEVLSGLAVSTGGTDGGEAQ